MTEGKAERARAKLIASLEATAADILQQLELGNVSDAKSLFTGVPPERRPYVAAYLMHIGFLQQRMSSARIPLLRFIALSTP